MSAAESGARDTRTRILLALALLVALATLGKALWLCRFGLDFTDESFYLVWMSNPFLYPVSASQFGFVYHPLFEALGGDIVTLRQANLLITFALSWALGDALLNPHLNPPRARLILSAAFASVAASSLVIAGLWLATPSYNTLTLQALLITAQGLASRERRPLAGTVLIAAGGVLVFLAKPPVAGALVLWVLGHDLAAGRFHLGHALATGLLSLVLLGACALAIDGSIAVFIARLQHAATLAKTLGGGHQLSHLLRLDDFTLTPPTRLWLGLVTATVWLAMHVTKPAAIALTAALALAAVVLVWYAPPSPPDGEFQALVLTALPLAALLATLSRARLFRVDSIRQNAARCLALLTLPALFAFGSNNNYWLMMGIAGVFFAHAALAFAAPRFALRELLPLVFGGQVLTLVLLQNGAASPYRQPLPLPAQTERVEIGRHRASLHLAPDVARYLRAATTLATQAPFAPGTPVIDLSGHSPGTLYALGATHIGQAWMVGGYPGSDALAQATLRQVSCDQLARAWLLLEPAGNQKISPAILATFGADLARDFELAGTLERPESRAGNRDNFTQQLMKPTRAPTAAEAACQAARAR